MDVQSKINKLLEKYPDPRKGAQGVQDFNHMIYMMSCPPVMGVVVDNKDPDCLGRLKVTLDNAVPGSVSAWLPVVKQWAKKESGWWCLPDIDTQVLAVFTSKDRSRGYVLGCIYDNKHLPPAHSSEKASGSTLLQTKNHRLEIIDEKDKEEIRLETAEGKMRVVLSKENGIQIVNGLGDVNIKCKNLTVEGEDEIHVSAGKGMHMETEDGFTAKTSGKLGIQSDKDITVKGKKIKLNGTKGVCAEGKQIAVEGDKVMGMDVHIMVVPAGTSTANVPIPHPFIGQLKDKLADDVTIGDKKAAIKGSKAKHQDSTTHMQMPGTIKFQSSPKCEGEVTNNVSSKVKIDGTEAATIGSTVTTCNDMGLQDNSTIIAVGMSIPMPAVINPLNTESYKKEKEEAEKKEPAFKNVKWAKTSCKEGEEIELAAGVKDIDDGNMVTLQVFPEGCGPENSIPYARFPLTVEGGSVSAKWRYSANHSEMPPENDPKFTFTAHCAWCNWEKSSNSLEVKLTRPEIKKAEWQDKDGKSTGKGLVGEVLKLHAETKDMEEGRGITFWIYDCATGKLVTSIGAEVKGDKADAEWNPIDTRNPDDTNALKYKFTVTANRCKDYDGSEIQVKNPKVVGMEWDKKAIYYGDKATLKIKTFELSDESPTCKLQLWEKDYTTEDDFILEQDITIDSDEVEQEIEFNFDTSRLKDENELELEIYGKLLYNGKSVDSKATYIIVKLGGRAL